MTQLFKLSMDGTLELTNAGKRRVFFSHKILEEFEKLSKKVAGYELSKSDVLHELYDLTSKVQREEE